MAEEELPPSALEDDDAETKIEEVGSLKWLWKARGSVNHQVQIIL